MVLCLFLLFDNSIKWFVDISENFEKINISFCFVLFCCIQLLQLKTYFQKTNAFSDWTIETTRLKIQRGMFFLKILFGVPDVFKMGVFYCSFIKLFLNSCGESFFNPLPIPNPHVFDWTLGDPICHELLQVGSLNEFEQFGGTGIVRKEKMKSQFGLSLSKSLHSFSCVSHKTFLKTLLSHSKRK